MCASALSSGINKNNSNKLITDGTLDDWPLDSIQLISFSAPTVGSDNFITHLNSTVLPIRVHVSGDPVTSDNIKGRHVGADLSLVNPLKAKYPKRPWKWVDTYNHEPKVVREQLLIYLTEIKVSIPNNAALAATCTPTFDKHTTFYDLVKAQNNLYLSNNFDQYLNDYRSEFSSMINNESGLLHESFIKTKKKLFQDAQTTILALIDNTLNTKISTLNGNWNAWVTKIKRESPINDLEGCILYVAEQSLIRIYSLTKKNNWKMTECFQPFAAIVWNSLPESKAIKHIAKSKPNSLDF
jgi:hypothetical protein